jgi:hypothetical protein
LNLNVPPARIPGEGGEHLVDLPAYVERIGTATTGSARSISRRD